jgi:transposase InsO family protein
VKEETVHDIQVAIKSGCRKAVATNDVGISQKTFNRWIENLEDKRKGPKTVPANKLSEAEIEEVLTISTSEEYMDLPPSQIVPSLADKGKYLACESTFYRILKGEDMLKHRGKSKPKKHEKPVPLVATGPNQIYSWDITYLKSQFTGQFYYLYLFMDIWSRKIVGQEVHENEDMNKSSALIDEICEIEKVEKGNLVLHSDNGGPMKGATMLATLQRLGIVPSFSRPKVSDDNPYSESLFKTLKYCPQYPLRPFSSLENAQSWVDEFVDWYNKKHLHSGIKFVTPESRHLGEDITILNRRKIVYETAKLANPNRWSGTSRNWDHQKKVYLNDLQKQNEGDRKMAS